MTLEEQLDEIGLLPIASEGVLLLAALPEFWQKFQGAPEFTDTLPDPMDRFSKRVIGQIAETHNLATVFPSDGPHYPPFVKWALASHEIFQSPIGLLVHGRLGLWISFRGALIGNFSAKLKPTSPCVNCTAPCLTTCPVSAFKTGEYNVNSCRNYLHSTNVECWRGCLARRICTANHIERDPKQSNFHMRAFAPTP